MKIERSAQSTIGYNLVVLTSIYGDCSDIFYAVSGQCGGVIMRKVIRFWSNIKCRIDRCLGDLVAVVLVVVEE